MGGSIALFLYKSIPISLMNSAYMPRLSCGQSVSLPELYIVTPWFTRLTLLTLEDHSLIKNAVNISDKQWLLQHPLQVGLLQPLQLQPLLTVVRGLLIKFPFMYVRPFSIVITTLPSLTSPAASPHPHT